MRESRTIEQIYEEPIGAREEIMAAYMERLEDAGMTIYREPRTVSRRELDYSSIEDGFSLDEV